MTIRSDDPVADLGFAAFAPQIDLVGQLRVSLALLLAPLVFMVALVAQPWLDPALLLRDPLAVAELNLTTCCKVYYGAVSNMGVMLWVSGAAVCLFAAAVVSAARHLTGAVVFLVAGGLLTGFLAVDDLFLVHENVLPAFGVPELVTYGGYAVLGLVYLAVSWREILRHNIVLLALAVALLGTSVVVDWFFHSDHPMRIVVEDGAKLGGITAWVGFHLFAAWKILCDDVRAPARRIGS